MRRPIATAAPDADPPPVRGGISRVWVIAVAAAVVVMAVVVGVVLSSHGSNRHHDGSDPTIQPTQIVSAPPDQPAVTAKYIKTQQAVVFTWTYQGAQPGDYFLVATALNAPKRQLRVARYVVHTTTPTTTCLVVAAYRGADQLGSEYSRRVCG